MSTTWESHLVLGCYAQDANDMGMESDHFQSYLYNEHNITWYEEDDFFGFELNEPDKLNIHTIQEWGKIARKVEGILGTDVIVKAVLFKY